MKIIILFSIAVVTLTSIASCAKDKVSPAQAQLTTIQLQKVIADSNIQRVLPFFVPGTNNYVNDDDGKYYSFSNGFVIFPGGLGSYNLNILHYYEVKQVGIGNRNSPTYYRCLVLYLYLD